MRAVQSISRRAASVATLVAFALSTAAGAQSTAPPPAAGGAPPAAGASAPADTPAFTKEELEQIAAPIALYPDSLLAQVFMAATYPLDIVSAERWRKANPSLKDKALEDALEKQPWDPAVKSLTVFPQVLTMMSEKLDW